MTEEQEEILQWSLARPRNGQECVIRPMFQLLTLNSDECEFYLGVSDSHSICMDSPHVWRSGFRKVYISQDEDDYVDLTPEERENSHLIKF